MKFWQSRKNPQCKLSQKDLLDISEEITQKYTPFDAHHQPELVLMPVDPVNLYAYWNLKESSINNEISHVDKPLALRIYSIPELSEHPDKLQLSFDIKVYGFRNQQKVHLPVAATAYSAVVGEIDADNSFSPLAISDTIHVPRENPVSDISTICNENRVQIDNSKENHIISPRDPQQSPAISLNRENYLNTLQFDPKINHCVNTQANAHDTQLAESFILKNFNGYGYDLTIYENGFAPDFNNMMAKQNINPHISDRKQKTTDNNISGQGRLIESL